MFANFDSSFENFQRVANEKAHLLRTTPKFVCIVLLTLVFLLLLFAANQVVGKVNAYCLYGPMVVMPTLSSCLNSAASSATSDAAVAEADRLRKKAACDRRGNRWTWHNGSQRCRKYICSFSAGVCWYIYS